MKRRISKEARVVVAGCICLDVIPTFEERDSELDALLTPGKLITVGPAVISTGGAVPNTGLALYRLGISTKLIGKVGDDIFGTAILDFLRRYDDALADSIVIGRDESSSYTLVISPTGVDRMFLHCPGANNTFGPDDVDIDRLAGARIFHFGYPPVMRRIYTKEGLNLVTIMERIKAIGLTTSLDMALPDPNSEAGQVDWVAILDRVLPYIDLFLPSLDEILFMLDRHRYDNLSKAEAGEFAESIDSTLVSTLAGRLLEMGAGIVALKLGSQGLYVRTSMNLRRLSSMGAGAPEDLNDWIGRELLAPCFKAKVVGTTGAGDCTIAGFLAGLLKAMPIEEVMTGAVAVGAFNVESSDATSGVPDWDTVQMRVKADWERNPLTLPLPDWQWDTNSGIWLGPNDKKRE